MKATFMGPLEFSESAVRLAGLMGAMFGWRPGEFWEATPAEVAVVIRELAGEAPAAASPDDLARLMEIFPDG